MFDRQVEVDTQPSGPVAGPAYGQQATYRASDAVPLVLDRVTAATIAVQELLP